VTQEVDRLGDAPDRAFSTEHRSKLPGEAARPVIAMR
jgi:hypothetical protein